MADEESSSLSPLDQIIAAPGHYAQADQSLPHDPTTAEVEVHMHKNKSDLN